MSKTLVAGFAALGCACVLAVSCVGFGIASADNHGAADVLNSNITFTTSPASNTSSAVSVTPSESFVLENAARRDVSQGFREIEEEEERARIAAEEAARAEERRLIAAAEAAKAAAAEKGQGARLAEVDFSCGKEAFVAEWTTRIDNYLAGSPLAGYGKNFAEAAWKYSVDPRWSPAISNTESTKGRNCFESHNAWGWMGNASWSSWEEAIDAHVAGLSRGYGYSISVANAKKYCPPTYMDWYEKTLSQMAII